MDKSADFETMTVAYMCAVAGALLVLAVSSIMIIKFYSE